MTDIEYLEDEVQSKRLQLQEMLVIKVVMIWSIVLTVLGVIGTVVIAMLRFIPTGLMGISIPLMVIGGFAAANFLSGLMGTWENKPSLARARSDLQQAENKLARAEMRQFDTRKKEQ